MTADPWTQAVRHQLGLGRLLPLGGPRDGAWVAEGAAAAVLARAAATEVPQVRLGTLRITLADPEDVHEPVVPPPPSALPPGALRVTADFAAMATDPLPTTASRLRLTLATAATDRLGLTVAEVDLRVTDLLEAAAADGQPTAVRAPQPPPARATTDPDESLAATAALSVPGVTRLTGSLGGLGRAVHIGQRTTDTSLPHRHVRVEAAVGRDYRAVDVARQVRAAVRTALEDHPTVAVLVTAVD
ncbi:nucleopolyhedrovirus P10 family protein [Streptomyces diastatochromogenes]|uniref:Nucleopolyhedrovirus P10 family protein n=1 Tax=Streptomyces diastatochromogenes TaxID=42236 RepID=A0A233SV52_STRDA|nr:nucleopolyhedrovirus P10 family protein [Streptomyces diastatochromogenes]OXY99519.1 nucleopolyhedrovirus P10 family protein [Streptomyces diastatochromogenes]